MFNSLASEHRNSPKACQLESPKKALTYFIVPVLVILLFIGYVMTHANVATCLSNYLPLALLTCACWLQVPSLRPWVLRLGMVPLLSFSWIVLLGRLILPLLAGPHWLASMAELYHVQIRWLVVGDIALHFGCFFAVQWLWVREAKAIKHVWQEIRVGHKLLAGYWLLIPYGVWLHAVNPLVVYKVPLHITWAPLYFWGYGMLLTSLGLAYVQWIMSGRKPTARQCRLSCCYWLVVVFVIIIAAWVDALALPAWLLLLLLMLYIIPTLFLFTRAIR